MKLSEGFRKKYAEELRLSLLSNDKLNNYILELCSSRSLNEAKYQIIEEQLKFLYDSLHSLSDAKNLEDRYQFQIDNLTNLSSTL